MLVGKYNDNEWNGIKTLKHKACELKNTQCRFLKIYKCELYRIQVHT